MIKHCIMCAGRILDVWSCGVKMAGFVMERGSYYSHEHEVNASCGKRMGEANKKCWENVIKLNHIWLKTWVDDNSGKKQSSIKNTLGLILGISWLERCK